MNRITRRDFAKSTLTSAASIVYSAQARGKLSRDRPNILFLMTDQHRADCVGSYGNRAIHTPNLDWMAREGVRFSRAYTSAPSCPPTRSAILTGLSPWHHGLLGYGPIATLHRFEMPRALSEAGYYTIALGKMHFSCPERNYHGFHQMLLEEADRADSPDFRSDYRSWFWSEAPNLDPDATGLGWNDYRSKAFALPERLHIVRWIGDTAVRFLRTYNRPKPFFLWVSIERPHSPYDPPKRFLRRYADAALPRPVVAKWAKRYKQRSGPGYDIWHGDLGSQQVLQSRRGYYGLVSFVDEQFGRIFEVLDQRGWIEETLIIHTADHGDMLGDHFLWRKCQPYEASARIPMLMRWPKGLLSAQRSQVVTQPVEARDILPTFLEAASVEPKAKLDGRSLLSLVRERKAEWRQYIDLEHDICYAPENHWNALTDGHFKYIFHALNGEEQLFDLHRDPNELNDLASDPAYGSGLREWRRRLVNHLAERGDSFVRNGELVRRPKKFTYSPNYPGCKGDLVHARNDAFVK
ncbi:MAG TPA: arylsulfatase [Acidobacteriota bacterium]|jgi:choline-sulfatase